MRMLVVEDEPKSRRGLQQMCNELYPNDEVMTAKNGEEALRLMKGDPVDVLLTDICMPTMDGITLMEMARVHGMTPEIIVISAYREFEYAQKALKLGARDYLLKPVSKADMQRVFDGAFKQISARKTAYMATRQMQDQLDKAIPAYVNHIMGNWVRGTLEAGQLHEAEDIFPIGQRGRLMMFRLDEPARCDPDRKSALLQELCGFIDRLLEPRGCALSFLLDHDREKRMVTAMLENLTLSPAEQQACADWAGERGISVAVAVSDVVEPLCDHISLAWEQLQQIGRTRALSKEPERAAPPRSEQVNEICAYIMSHMAQELTLSSIAAAFHYSPPYLSRVFNGHMGISLNEYITRVRIDHAREMLVITDLHVYEIARKIGYGDVQYFHRVFRKRVGVTPDTFRRMRNVRKGG